MLQWETEECLINESKESPVKTKGKRLGIDIHGPCQQTNNSNTNTCDEESSVYSEDCINLKESKSKNNEISSNKKYKTQMCKNFLLDGYCKFSSNCNFAHGEYEL